MSLTEDANDYKKLAELSESDYEIADGQPDIQGWDVRDSQGNKLGEVDEMLFNAASLKVRYVIVHMENNDIGLEDGRVIIPIGVAELDEKKDIVTIPNVTKAQMLALPIYESGREIDSDTEAQIRRVFSDPDAVYEPSDTNFYDHDHFSETRFYGKRSPDAERIVSKTYLETPPGDDVV